MFLRKLLLGAAMTLAVILTVSCGDSYSSSSSLQTPELTYKPHIPAEGHGKYDPLDLSSSTLSWSVAFVGDDPYENPLVLVEKIHKVLEDQRGWQAAGINFLYTQHPVQADILFIFLDVTQKDIPFCPLACIFQSDGDTCFLGINEKYKRLLEGLTDIINFTSIINHEVGHCFLGLYHYGDGIMGQPETQDYPDAEEIQLVREKLRMPSP